MATLTVTELKKHLAEINKITSDEWMVSLNERKLEELSFHDKYRDRDFIKKTDKKTFEKIYRNLFTF